MKKTNNTIKILVTALGLAAGSLCFASQQGEKTPDSPPPTYTDPATGMEFVLVKGGCYQMGDTFAVLYDDGYDGKYNERPVHEVCVDDFYMGKYEVTQGEWEKIMGSNPSDFKKGDNYPVENVSWNDIMQFLPKLNSRSCRKYRLPTEAEWEYAARSGGKKEKYAGGNTVDVLTWYSDNSGMSTHKAGTKRANGLGLYDMSGNVSEWCLDWYGRNYYKKSPKQNPLRKEKGSRRVARGGSWYDSPRFVRSAKRFRLMPDVRDNGLGFRLVLPVYR